MLQTMLSALSPYDATIERWISPWASPPENLMAGELTFLAICGVFVGAISLVYLKRRLFAPKWLSSRAMYVSKTPPQRRTDDGNFKAVRNDL